MEWQLLKVRRVTKEDSANLGKTQYDIKGRYTTLAAALEGYLEYQLHDIRASLTLSELVGSEIAGKFDFAFIDADKTNYDQYYEYCLSLVRVGGLIVLDNALWGGQVVDTSYQDEDTQAIRAMNEKLRDDSRVDVSLLPVGDGVYLARKR